MSTAPGIRIAGRAGIGGTPLFGPLALEIGAGQWTCLLGPSGVGKSTLLRVLAGLAGPVDFTGEIAVDGQTGIPLRPAYMAQDDLLFPWLDVLGNTLTGARLRGETPDRARARTIIERTGLSGHVTKRPSELSGGMRQRVALARTLMEDRAVVLLDEPFSALDAGTRAEMQELAAELLAGRTVLLVTHDPAEAARLGHRIAVMTPQGLTDVAPPAGVPIRAFDDPEVLSCQARLLAQVREAT